MPDMVDAIQQRALDEAASLVEAHARRPKPAGLTVCECGQGITPARTALGARLCLECQQEQERQQTHGLGARR